MTREELMSKLNEVGTSEDAAQRRAILSEIVDAAKAVYDENDTLRTSNTKFEEDNKKLQEYNMQLFLRVGNQQTKKEPAKQEPDTKRSYENLFNEKGELK